MPVEIELRRVCYFKSYDDALNLFNQISAGGPHDEYSVHYIGSFRMKNDVVEHKEIESKSAVYVDGTWFQMVRSIETPYRRWTREMHRQYAYRLSHEAIVSEYRTELTLSPNAKFFAFRRSDGKCGIVFELERNNRDDEKPFPYRKYYAIERQSQQEDVFPTRKYMKRKPVTHLCSPLPSTTRYFRAVKHDGVHGFVLCFRDRLEEIWEDSMTRVVPCENFCPGLVFSAERCGGTVVLLDVVSVKNLPTFRDNVKHVLYRFLRDVVPPEGYAVQKYVKYNEEWDPETMIINEGLIFHTYDDRIFKEKRVKTVELIYEDGFLKSFERKYRTSEPLRQGHVYECNLADKTVVRERRDRYMCNTEEQIRNASSSSST